ncbi:MAG: hypothetical protein ACXACI_08475 [Candidatus Hodarchaeales archaeon]
MRSKRLTISTAFLSALLIFLTIPSAMEGQSAIVRLQQEDENLVSLQDSMVSLWRDDEWTDLSVIDDREGLPVLEKGDRLKFEATIVNQNKTEIELESFSAFIYNITDIRQSFVESYKTGTPKAVKLAQNTSKTEVSEGTLDIIENGTYRIQVRFTYRLGADSLAAKARNVTFEILDKGKAPPEIVLWVWAGITAFLIGVLSIGIYGNLQLRKIEKE